MTKRFLAVTTAFVILFYVGLWFLQYIDSPQIP